MKRPTLAQILNTYGIKTPQDLHRIIRSTRRQGYTEAYARMLYAGAKPVSKKVAAALRKHTGGALTLDLLVGLDNGR